MDINSIFLTAANGAGPAFGLSNIMLIVLILGIFYVLLVMPQKKEKKRLEEMYKSMEVGDVVVTTCGFYGVLIDITEDEVIVEFGSNKNCRIPMRKSAIERVEKQDAESND